MRLLLSLLVVGLSILVGWLLHQEYSKPNIEAVAMRVEDQLQAIAQLATAEGKYSRLIRHEETGYTTWFPGTDKRILVKADARVLVGFDLEGVRVEVNHANKSMHIVNWPAAEELSFAFETQYLDLEAGLFVDIESRDLNAIRSEARRVLEDAVDFAALARESYLQAQALFSILQTELAASGWDLEVVGRPELVGG